MPKLKVVFVRQTAGEDETKSELPDIDDYLLSSKTCDEFFTSITEMFSSGVTAKMEITTRGQPVNLL